MNHILFVVDTPERWKFDVPGVTVVSARQYLTDPQFLRMRSCRVYNLCRHYRYQSGGYYVSLLAEARGHRPLPRITTIQDLKTSSIFRAISSDLDELIQKSLAPLQSEEFTLSIYFSRNVAKRYERHKIHAPKTKEEYDTAIQQLLDKSDLIIAQEFMPTEFDWRIGIIDRKPLYACKYYMARGHWQIYDHSKKGNESYGRADTFALKDVPETVVQTALKAANAIGDGLYGVDLKMINGKAYVIEVNDNPSIEAGIEDEVSKDELYTTIMQVFRKRLEKRGDSD